MTEAEWQVCEQLDALLAALYGREGEASERRCWLFGCACCRRIWQHLDEQGRRFLEIVERCADGVASEAERYAAVQALSERRYVGAILHAGANAPTIENMEEVADKIASEPPPVGYHLGYEAWSASERAAQRQLLRCIFGNPFHPMKIDENWLRWNNATVVQLAQAANDERSMPSGLLDNCRLAILADALEDAGCTNPRLLEHCRGPGPHVRGCWVLDAILAKP